MTVLLTRPRPQADETACLLASMGLPVMLAPLMETVRTGWPAPGGVFDGLIVTSRSARPALEAERDLLSDLPVIAVGERTAADVLSAGYRTVCAAQGDARSLVSVVAASFPAGARFLHAAGRYRKLEPGTSLRALGYVVNEWECYEARPASGLPSHAVEAFQAGRIGAVLHYSRRSAELFVDAVSSAGIAGTASCAEHFCLSADVAAALRGLARREIQIAPAPCESALVDLLLQRARWTRPPRAARPKVLAPRLQSLIV